MKKATKHTKTTENRPVTSGNLPQGRAIKHGLSHGLVKSRVIKTKFLFH